MSSASLNVSASHHADIKITCQACGHESVVFAEDLARSLFSKGYTVGWDDVPKRLRCRCGAKHPTIEEINVRNPGPR